MAKARVFRITETEKSAISLYLKEAQDLIPGNKTKVKTQFWHIREILKGLTEVNTTASERKGA